jgi:hypothetical protein
MNLSLLLNLVQRVKAHPVTTIAGLLLSAAYLLTGTHDTHTLLAAIGTALLGAIAKDK